MKELQIIDELTSEMLQVSYRLRDSHTKLVACRELLICTSVHIRTYDVVNVNGE